MVKIKENDDYIAIETICKSNNCVHHICIVCCYVSIDIVPQAQPLTLFYYIH